MRQNDNPIIQFFGVDHNMFIVMAVHTSVPSPGDANPKPIILIQSCSLVRQRIQLKYPSYSNLLFSSMFKSTMEAQNLINIEQTGSQIYRTEMFRIPFNNGTQLNNMSTQLMKYYCVLFS